MATRTRQERLEEAARDSLTLCLMAYMGNCGERQALRGIRELLLPLFPPAEKVDNG